MKIAQENQCAQRQRKTEKNNSVLNTKNIRQEEESETTYFEGKKSE